MLSISNGLKPCSGVRELILQNINVNSALEDPFVTSLHAQNIVDIRSFFLVTDEKLLDHAVEVLGIVLVGPSVLALQDLENQRIEAVGVCV